MDSHPLFFLNKSPFSLQLVMLLPFFLVFITSKQGANLLRRLWLLGLRVDQSPCLISICATDRQCLATSPSVSAFNPPHTLRNTTVRLPDIHSSFSASWKAWKQLITLDPRAGEVGWINLCLKENLGGCFLFCPPQKSFMHDEISHRS